MAAVYRCRLKPEDTGSYDGVHGAWHFYHPSCMSAAVREQYAEVIASTVAVSRTAPCQGCNNPLHDPSVSTAAAIAWVRDQPDGEFIPDP